MRRSCGTAAGSSSALGRVEIRGEALVHGQGQDAAKRRAIHVDAGLAGVPRRHEPGDGPSAHRHREGLARLGRAQHLGDVVAGLARPARPRATGRGAAREKAVQPVTLAIAWSRSQTMSSRSSTPTATRTMSSVTPAAAQPLVVEAAVGGGGGVDDERLGVAHVGQVRAELAGLDQAPPGLAAAADAEGEDRPGAARQVALGELAVGAVRQPRVAHPLDAGVVGEEARPRRGRCRRGGPCAATGSRGPAAAGRR